jgi:hemolysin activation/secretion protein
MRYQGNEAASIEAELRWQFWRRFSAVAFGGFGAAWNDFARFKAVTTVPTGGVGFRYEIARSTAFTGDWTWRSARTTPPSTSRSSAPGARP